MPSTLFDSCIYISRKEIEHSKNILLSAVVLQEMTAGANDKQELKFWEATRKSFEKQNKLLVPNAEDWWLAGKVLNSLLRGLKSDNKGKTPKLLPTEKHRIIRDVLIARTAKRENAVLVTDNLKDFELIKRFCNVRVVSGKDFFGNH